MVLRSVGVLSVGKVLGILYALMGLIIGGFMSLIALAGFAGNAQQQPGQNAVPFMAIGAAAVVVLPIVYGFMGFIFGIIGAALYNVVAGIVGGLELDIVRPVSPNTDAQVG